MYDPKTRLREPRLLTTADAARIIGVHPDTMRKWRKTSDGPAYVMIGSRYRYTPRAVQEYITAQGKQL